MNTKKGIESQPFPAVTRYLDITSFLLLRNALMLPRKGRLDLLNAMTKVFRERKSIRRSVLNF